MSTAWHHLVVDNVGFSRRTGTGAAGAPAWRVLAIRGNHTRLLHNNIKLYLMCEQDCFNNYRIYTVVTINCNSKLQKNEQKNNSSLTLTTISLNYTSVQKTGLTVDEMMEKTGINGQLGLHCQRGLSRRGSSGWKMSRRPHVSLERGTPAHTRIRARMSTR